MPSDTMSAEEYNRVYAEYRDYFDICVFRGWEEIRR